MRGIDSVEHMMYGLPLISTSQTPDDVPLVEDDLMNGEELRERREDGRESFDKQHGDQEQSSRPRPKVMLDGRSRIVSMLPLGSALKDLFNDPYLLIRLHPSAFPHMTGLRPEGMSLETWFKIIAEREPITNMQVKINCSSFINTLKSDLPFTESDPLVRYVRHPHDDKDNEDSQFYHQRP